MRKPAIWILALTLTLASLAGAAPADAASRRPLDVRAALGQACRPQYPSNEEEGS